MSTTKRPAQETLDQGQRMEDNRSIEFDLPKDFMKFTPTTIKGKKRAMSCDADPDYDLPKGFVRFTPMTEPKRRSNTPGEDMEYDLPKDFMKFTPTGTSAKKKPQSAKKQSKLYRWNGF